MKLSGTVSILSTVAIIIWLITIPTWVPFFKYAQGLTNADEIFLIVLKLAPFYIAYAGCTIIDNIFILMFGFGMVVHLIISIVEEKLIFKGKT